MALSEGEIEKIATRTADEVHRRLSEYQGESLGNPTYSQERERLVGLYGSWPVRRSELLCDTGDIACVEARCRQYAEWERKRERYLKLRDRFATERYGKPFNELSEEQQNWILFVTELGQARGM